MQNIRHPPQKNQIKLKYLFHYLFICGIGKIIKILNDYVIFNLQTYIIYIGFGITDIKIYVNDKLRLHIMNEKYLYSGDYLITFGGS